MPMSNMDGIMTVVEVSRSPLRAPKRESIKATEVATPTSCTTVKITFVVMGS